MLGCEENAHFLDRGNVASTYIARFLDRREGMEEEAGETLLSAYPALVCLQRRESLLREIVHEPVHGEASQVENLGFLETVRDH